jgi:cephalosporin hydroxylase
MSDSAIREFHRLYYEHGCHAEYGKGLHAQTNYHGISTHKCPLDLWVFQEILHEVRPALVIELGTYLGGTTLFLAHQLELFGEGRVVSVDRRELERPQHHRISYVLGETDHESTVASVRDHVTACEERPVIVIHDADHRCDQVLADLECYAPFVTAASYLIVEDSNVNGHPVLNGWGAGPFEAIENFCERHPDFAPDPAREKFLLTYNPGGYLKRMAAP